MKMIRSIIVDDEAGGISNLQCYLHEHCPLIEVFKTESNLNDIPLLLQEKIDIAFLDIEICNDNIFNILQKVGKINFDIVFVTAYEQYAFKSFNVDVLDYLLKPIQQKSIINCYNKILKRFSLKENTQDAVRKGLGQSSQKNIVLKHGEKVFVVTFDDIVYLKASGAYTEVCIYQDNQKHLITVSKSLAEISEEYMYDAFYKTHRSYIINTNKIAEIYKNNNAKLKMITGEIIPVARRRWLDFLSINNL